MSMIKDVIRFAFFALLFPQFSTAAAHASSPHTDSVQFCVPFDYEQWRRDHPLPAGKRAADLNVGEPRTVRMIYFLPNDRSYQGHVVQKMKDEIRKIQTLYAEQMQAHGFGRRTFRFETDSVGGPLVRRKDGQYANEHYHRNTVETVFEEIHKNYDLSRNSYFVVIDNGKDYIRGNGRSGRGVATSIGKAGGWLLLPEEFRFQTAAHELGHTFGLKHDFRDGWVHDYEYIYIMGYGPRSPSLVLAECSAGFLAVHPYFNPDVPIEVGSPPTVELLSATEYPIGSESVSVQLKLSDAKGLHQVILFTGESDLLVWGCHSLTRRDEKAEFEFSPHEFRLNESSSYRLTARAVDTDGDVTDVDFLLEEEASPRLISVWNAHKTEGHIRVVMSPNGRTLASASSSLTGGGDGAVKLWDVATQTQVGTLVGYPKEGGSDLAFSPDGRMLAFGSDDWTIGLWNVATQAKVGKLVGHTDWIGPLAFSPDGKILASGDGVVPADIRLWDVAEQREIGTLEGHETYVSSLAFSPDGETLASGGADDRRGTTHPLRLWDVQTRELKSIVNLSDHNLCDSVTYSPDGATLACGSKFGAILLWDVQTQAEIATLGKLHTSNVFSVAFSPVRAVLASSQGNAVKLWNLTTGTEIAVLAHPSALRSVAFAPHGAILVTGIWNGSIRLWNLVEMTRPRSSTLEIVSGDGQHGSPGAMPAQPLVVEVRDQYGNLRAGVTVTFAVTAGGGAVSETTVTTDANGRAATTLTLGNQPATNTVTVTVQGLDPVTFSATGIAHADFDGDGVVGFADFVQFAARFGLSSGDAGFDARYDLDGDDTIGFGDFVIFASAFGRS